MRSRRWRALVLVLCTAAVALFVFRAYYGGPGLLFGDANFLWARSLITAELHQYLHVWRPAESGGMTGAIANASQDYLLVQTMFSLFGVAVSGVLVFPFLLTVAFLAFYGLARIIGADRFAAVCSALFFAGNPWIWDQLLAGHVAIVAAVSFSPLVFYALTRLYAGRTAFGFLLFALTAVELALDPRISLFVFAGLAIAGIAGFVLHYRAGARTAAFTFLAFALAAPVFAFVCNGSWTILYAFVKNANLVPFFYPPVEDAISYSAFSDLWHTLALSGYFIHFSWSRASQAGSTFMVWYACALVVLLLPLYAVRKRRLVVWLAIPALVAGLVLSMGAQGLPLPLLYGMYSHLPLMSLLREPIKFGYAAAFAMAVLLALALTSLRKGGRIVVGAAVFIVVLPIFTGTLSVPDGHGLQAFTARPDYVRLLSYFEQQRAKSGDFRIAVLPPWLAEQSLSNGAFFTVNPFVIQSEIPVIDAKLLNTANATAQHAWQAFYGLYWGTDAHPAATLADFGVKYVVVPSSAALSPGAAMTSFPISDSALNAAVLAGDPQFVPVYDDGVNRVFENRSFRSIYRTARTPIIAGAVPALVRQALPQDALGDAFASPGGTQPPPLASLSLGATALARCIDLHGALAERNAYYSVSKHNDYTGYWVASDWLLPGPDNYRDRILTRFPLPYAYTESRSAIDVPIESRSSRARVLVEAASVGSQAVLQVSIDGGVLRSFDVDSTALGWYDAGSVGAGRHDVRIIGSPAGAVARRVVLDDGTCAQASNRAEAGGDAYYIPGPTRAVAVSLGPKTTELRLEPLPLGGAQLNPPPQSFPTPEGAAALMWDLTPIASGQTFRTMTGLHRLFYVAPDGPATNGDWAFSNAAPYQINAGSKISGTTATLVGGRWPQRIDMLVDKLPNLQKTLIRVSVTGPLAGSTLTIWSGGNRVSSYELKPGYIVVPYLGSAYSISVATAANAAGSQTLALTVHDAGVLGTTQLVRIPGVAARVQGVPVKRVGSVLANYVLAQQGALEQTGLQRLNVDLPRAGGLLLELHGLRASAPGRAVVTAYYHVPAGTLPLTIADVQAGTSPADRVVGIPIVPYADRVALSITPISGEATVFSVRSAQLRVETQLAGGIIVRVPHVTVSGGNPVAADDREIERIPFANPRSGYLVANFTYEPNWSIDSQPHWAANGFANAWQVQGPGVMTYALQRLYLQLLAAGLVLWLCAVAAFIIWYRR